MGYFENFILTFYLNEILQVLSMYKYFKHFFLIDFPEFKDTDNISELEDEAHNGNKVLLHI